MSPLPEAVTELRLVVDRAANGIATLRRGQSVEDFRTETIADLLDAMDRIDPYLGTKLMLVIYPHADAQRANS